MNKDQIQLLKHISKCGLFDYSNISADEREVLFYLRKQNFITPCAGQSIERPLYKITELGKDELFLLKQSSFKFWLPIIISLVALIKSFMPEILSLLRLLMQ